MTRPTATRGGNAVVRALREREVDLVFGIPGTHNLEIYRALRSHGIRHVAPRHEQGGGYAADAYSRVTNRPGVVITTTGPGLTNATTAAATSYADSVPVLLISPGLPRGMVGRDLGWLHEVKDQSGHLDAMVERSIRVESAEEAYAAIHETFDHWQTNRPRPVHLEVPVDVLDGGYDDTALTRPEPVHRPVPTPERQLVGAAADALAQASSVVLVVGGGCRQASEQVLAVAERLDAPVVTTVNGKGVVPETHPLSLGACIRLPETHRILAGADALLVVGSVLGSSELWGHRVEASGVVVRVDIDERQLHKNLTATHPLHGGAAETLALLLDELPDSVQNRSGRQVTTFREAVRRGIERDGSTFIGFHDALAAALPETTIFAGDSAQVSYFGTASLWPAVRPGQFLYPAGYGTLGYGIPAAIGAALGAPETPVVVVAGDGGTMFTIQEFATAVDLGLGLPVVVMNNGGFQEIREGMEERGIDPLAVDVRSPDFPMLATALGGEGVRVHTPEELAKAVTQALGRSVPTLIEVPI
ncbi:thiamine pyrophosphate-binding protein [Nocardioides caldifontis]|uniref:thiamine pyrophosphate-binding protein n=1 Tax=Nocardioides caldifontis TaxID=2588938 RepID=UPI001396CF7E|nr:thiamine pyrophosphate-dependent enzyme [Nocardioides caldifontis]